MIIYEKYCTNNYPIDHSTNFQKFILGKVKFGK
jgi:hypothetical protein